MESAGVALAEVDKVIAVNRARYKQGEISGGELRRLEVERMKFTDDELAARLAEKNARGALLALLGAPRLDVPLEPTDTLKAPASEAAARTGGAGGTLDSSALIARALTLRPDLTAARREEQRAQSEVRLQQALRLPTVTFGAGYHHDVGANGLAISASVPLPLFDRNAGGIARAEAERRLAASQTRAAERAVSLDVQRAVNAVEVMAARLAALESDYLQKAREARDTALAAYRSGATDLIDYLDAERSYRDVQRTYQRALFDHRISLSELDAAVGALPGDLQP
jgi:cobalt-zinc-cadmium efflux system outer membrane protein